MYQRKPDSIEQTFNREGSLYLACNEKRTFFTSAQPKRFKLWSCQKVCDALHYLLDNIFIRFCSKLYRQIVGIPMGTNFGLRLVHYKWSNVSTKIVNFPFLDGDFPRSPSYGVFISQLNRFARICSHVDDFKNRKK